MDSLFPEENKTKKIYVNELQVGKDVQSLFVITRIALREYDKGQLLNLRLGDKTGKVSAVLWGGAEEAYKRLREGDLVSVAGKVNSYQNDTQITVRSIQAVPAPEDLDPADFLPASLKPLEEMAAEFDGMLETMKDEDYRALLLAFRQDESLWQEFSRAPGAKMWHHPYLHGLLEHTLSVMRLCRAIAPNYPRVAEDLLLAGAVFHDAGKMREFVYHYRIDYSTDGRLLGHIYMGTALAENLMDRLPDFPPEKRRRLLHVILSHHGEVERSPILPMTLEANLLHHIENMDAQMAAYEREMDKAESGAKEWTGYVNLIQRYLYLGENHSPSQNDRDED
ncbi:MAG: HD domain-containing protein [Candidatus Omnitrophota bacterium]